MTGIGPESGGAGWQETDKGKLVELGKDAAVPEKPSVKPAEQGYLPKDPREPAEPKHLVPVVETVEAVEVAGLEDGDAEEENDGAIEVGDAEEEGENDGAETTGEAQVGVRVASGDRVTGVRLPEDKAAADDDATVFEEAA